MDGTSGQDLVQLGQGARARPGELVRRHHLKVTFVIVDEQK